MPTHALLEELTWRGLLYQQTEGQMRQEAALIVAAERTGRAAK